MARILNREIRILNRRHMQRARAAYILFCLNHPLMPIRVFCRRPFLSVLYVYLLGLSGAQTWMALYTPAYAGHVVFSWFCFMWAVACGMVEYERVAADAQEDVPCN